MRIILKDILKFPILYHSFRAVAHEESNFSFKNIKLLKVVLQPLDKPNKYTVEMYVTDVMLGQDY